MNGCHAIIKMMMSNFRRWTDTEEKPSLDFFVVLISYQHFWGFYYNTSVFWAHPVSYVVM